jgi:hypothetical protein
MMVVVKGELLKSRCRWPRSSKALEVKSAGTQHRHPRGSCCKKAVLLLLLLCLFPGRRRSLCQLPLCFYNL